MRDRLVEVRARDAARGLVDALDRRQRAAREQPADTDGEQDRERQRDLDHLAHEGHVLGVARVSIATWRKPPGAATTLTTWACSPPRFTARSARVALAAQQVLRDRQRLARERAGRGDRRRRPRPCTGCRGRDPGSDSRTVRSMRCASQSSTSARSCSSRLGAQRLEQLARVDLRDQIRLAIDAARHGRVEHRREQAERDGEGDGVAQRPARADRESQAGVTSGVGGAGQPRSRGRITVSGPLYCAGLARDALAPRDPLILAATPAGADDWRVGSARTCSRSRATRRPPASAAGSTRATRTATCSHSAGGLNHVNVFVDTRWQSVQAFVEGEYERETDLAGYEGEHQLELEQAYVRWQPSEAFGVRAGRFNTPFGWWVPIHWSILMDFVTPPQYVGKEVVPEQQIGLEFAGRLFPRNVFGLDSEVDWSLFAGYGARGPRPGPHGGRLLRRRPARAARRALSARRLGLSAAEPRARRPQRARPACCTARRACPATSRCARSTSLRAATACAKGAC